MPTARNVRYWRRIAYHEAGHAVAAAVLERQFLYVTIRPKGKIKGHVAYSRAAEHRHPTPPMIQAIVALAGAMAEGKYTRRKAVSLFHGSDKERVEDLEISGEIFLHAVAASHLLVTLHWKEVKVVAGALQKQGTLDQADVQMVVSHHGSLAEYERFNDVAMVWPKRRSHPQVEQQVSRKQDRLRPRPTQRQGQAASSAARN